LAQSINAFRLKVLNEIPGALAEVPVKDPSALVANVILIEAIFQFLSALVLYH
jgi:hypothetical protein